MINIDHGIAYENNKPIILHIIDIEPLKDYKLVATFSDGVTKMYDFSPLLEFEVFQPLKDINEFKNVTLDHGVPTWQKYDVDLAPETIYAHGKVVEYA